MPGIVYHLYFGKQTLEGLLKKGIRLDNPEKYLLGNIMPDFATYKDSTHHYPNDSNTFFVPNLKAAKERYSRVTNPNLRYGILAHLYLDKRFTEDFLMPRFTYNPVSELVTKTMDPKYAWTLPKFFSYDGLYRAYSEINPLMFDNDLLSIDWLVQNIPDRLPTTGLFTLDNRFTDDWFEFLVTCLVRHPTYTGELFTYDEFVEFLDRVIDDFVSRDNEALGLPQPRPVYTCHPSSCPYASVSVGSNF